YIQVIADSQTDISQVKYNGGGTEVEGNIAVATVKTSTGIKFEGASQKQGFDIIGTTLKEVSGTDEYGKIKNASSSPDSEESVVSSSSVSSGSSSTSTDYTTYFVDKMTSKGAGVADQQASAQAMGLNYELFLANFNSLNKRMGELRNNDHSQGAWGRIFNGMLESNFALKSKTIYTTIQAGYDYAFGFEGANNYLGLALSYANAIVDPENMTDLYGQSGVEKATQHGIELAVYNSYVQDEGWFNDTIAKFSFITSSINMIGQSSTYNSNNWGAVLSNEFGYRFKLGETKEWYIDPQVELGFGYFNQSNLKQVLGQASLTGIQKEILTLRTRAGATWGYDFKNFTEGKKIKASLYLGTYYSYDYIAGGEIDLETNLKVKSQTFRMLNSTGRFELNVGTNIQLQDNIRVYADFERSFGGDIVTEYQVNLGVRYSFGEGTYTPKPMLTQEKETLQAPVKLEEK
ncbi:autotransporter outer membrane beta-barrel domain-containing protein, partial [Helicobacter kayseriensis]|uniref:autotransporter outer membrane beta-barrel domain-containing protein n=1 Tax=Helicobacter kayseriensis TaxID=2905877 RepID=UPI001E3AC422